MSIQDNDDDMTTKENPEAPQEQEVPSLTSSDVDEPPETQEQEASASIAPDGDEPLETHEQEIPAPASLDEDKTPETQEQEVSAPIAPDGDEPSESPEPPHEQEESSDESSYIPSPEEQLSDDEQKQLQFFQDKFAPKANDLTVYTPDGEDELHRVVSETIEYILNPKFGKHYRYSFDDTGIGRLFADSYKWKLRYVPEWKEWVEYNGAVWAPCGSEIMEYCKDFTEKVRYFIDGYRIPPNSLGMQAEVIGRKIGQIKSITDKWQSRKARETILKDAASVHPVSINEFDKKPFIFNCKNGTLNFETWRFTDHDPQDMLMKMANVSFDNNATCARWEKHMEQVFEGDADLIKYFRKALGYALTGDTRYECFFILYGPTSRNGKGVTMGTFQHMLGDYACNTSPDTITQRKFTNSGGPSEDIARLRGAHFVSISEPDQNMVLSSALVKTLTGNDVITARMLYKNSFEFKPVCKFFINTNYLPQVSDPTLFASGRVKVIPFKHHFGPDEQDPGLKDELIQEENLSGILRWCTKGLRNLRNNKFSKEAFDEPEAVKIATEEYKQVSIGNSARQNTDEIAQFIADALEESRGDEIRTMLAFGQYCAWCEEKRREPCSKKMFSQKMENHVTIKRKRPAGKSDANPVSMIIGYKFKSKE